MTEEQELRPIHKILSDRLRGEHMPFLQVLLGPRQVGKSTIVNQIAKSWDGPVVAETADGVSTKDHEWLEFHWQRARDQSGCVLLAIDEIQKVQGWSETVKVLFEKDRLNPNLRIVLTGSASLTLQKGLTESLAGRYELLPCPHWGFDECKSVFKWDLLTYLKFGGYPAPAKLISDASRWREFIRDSIIEPVIGRDLLSAVSIQKPALLRQLFELTMNYPAQEISFQKILGQLQDKGNTTTLKSYLEILEAAFLIKMLQKYSTNPLQKKMSSPKILPLAPALIHAYTNASLVDTDSEWRGRVFETAVGIHLSKLNTEIFYWREGQDEVDFVLNIDRILVAIEVKSGRRKSQKGLIKFKEKFPNARTVLMDWEKAQKWLSLKPSFEELLKLQ